MVGAAEWRRLALWARLCWPASPEARHFGRIPVVAYRSTYVYAILPLSSLPRTGLSLYLFVRTAFFMQRWIP